MLSIIPSIPFWIVFVPIGAFAMVTALFWLASRRKQTIAAIERDVQLALLSKFSTADEMSGFIATPEGRLFVERLGRPKGLDPKRQLMDYLTGGIVTLFLGAAFMLAARGLAVLALPGLICLALGIALLISAAVIFPIAKRLGQVEPR